MTDNKKKEKIIEPEVVEEITKDDKQLAMLGHILAIIGGFVVPLIIYLLKKDESEFIEDQAKEALNFQITVAIAALVGIVFTIATCGYGGIVFAPIGILNMVFCIIAGIKANEGEKYRYPINIRIIK